ncbi:transposase IS3/IS911 family protein [Ketogulonicigenium robustum]|uniref:Transposase IS3/IS911 family protein n=1 Tax=Ketogulonicigenium robustum TaxID=92947 RepID=A0A1W6P035_9RHOB|nr:transposase IS3/IS911 family protein [Ketogulonicigenium robustum]
MSPATFYKLKAKYGGMDLSDANRLKQLEAEHAKLKRLVADVMLDSVALKDLLGKPRRRRCNGGTRCCGR